MVKRRLFSLIGVGPGGHDRAQAGLVPREETTAGPALFTNDRV